MVRGLILLIALTSIASADVCKDPAACERACAKTDIAACTQAADGYFKGENGWPLDHAKVMTFAKRACDANEFYGCTLLGYELQDGLGAPRDLARALVLYEKACTGGDGTGCINLGLMYASGLGVAFYDDMKHYVYKERARDVWAAACETTARACTSAAWALHATTKSPPGVQDKALALHKRSCDAGVTEGCLYGATLRFELGKLDAPGYTKELERLCLRANEREACSTLATILLEGKHAIAQDGKRAIELLVRGCDGGNTQSCYQLGLERTSGEHTKLDRAAATRAFDSACDRAYPDACWALAQSFKHDKNDKRAADYARRACHMSKSEACVMLAASAKDPREATAWATEACRMRHIPGCRMLIDSDAPLPLPDIAQQRLYTRACNEQKIAAACKRLAKP